MYTGLLHTHRLAVILFLVLYLIKAVMLLLNRKEGLQKLTKATRIPEMIISFLFLATGIGLLINVAQINTMLIIKIALVLASIPVAVIGFRRENKLLAVLSVLLIVGAYGLAEMNKVGVEETPLAQEITDPTAEGYDLIAHGQALYSRNCVVCHGEQGNLAKSGAKNLQESQLSEAEMTNLIQNGKNAMPAYKDVPGYDEAGIAAVIAFINKNIRKK
ncbi:MAG: SirB2 family protein [Bacteroidia bacterium]|nr:SirB2 family protein [Bacteroidia bacterium]